MKGYFWGIILVNIFSSMAYADYAKISCGNQAKSVKLSIDELGDISKNSVALIDNKINLKVSKVKVTSTQYGVLAIEVETGKSNTKSNYYFENLGSQKCFGVFESGQKGSASLRIQSSSGAITKLSCRCSVD